MRLIEKVWFHQHPMRYLIVPLLLPLSLLFYVISTIRRILYRLQIFSSVQVAAPVIVVGNISVGGNGKTPIVLWLIEHCRQLGLTPGVISRGYGGSSKQYPLLLNEQTSPEQAGDEPVMIYQRAKVAVAVGPDRIASAKLLIEQGCNIIISDDGLQHYRLKRQLELVIVDGKRQFGNKLLLPMGPLREGLWRLQQVDYVIVNGATPPLDNLMNERVVTMTLVATQVINVLTGEKQSVEQFVNRFPTINAIAGIGSPQRFFDNLRQLHFSLNQTRSFIDHHHFELSDFNEFSSEQMLLMTEKDAVKCKRFAQKHWWYLPVDAKLEPHVQQQIEQQIKLITSNI